jgi:genome maintenance exonuclease 1
VEFKYQLVDETKMNRTMYNGKRHYSTPEGKRYQSVTTVLGQLSEEGIAKWRKTVGDEEADRISKESSKVGTAMHQMCENYLLGVEETETDELVISLFNQIKPKLDTIESVHGVELPLYSDYLKMAGTADLICTIDGDVVIPDFKNSRKPKLEYYIDGYFMQGTAYARMFYERYGVLPKRIIIWVAVWGGELQEFIVPIEKFYPKLINVLRAWHPEFKG